MFDELICTINTNSRLLRFMIYQRLYVLYDRNTSSAMSYNVLMNGKYYVRWIMGYLVSEERARIVLADYIKNQLITELTNIISIKSSDSKIRSISGEEI